MKAYIALACLAAVALAEPYRGYGGYGYAGYPTVYGGYGHFYGKRSADAEPKAEADPYVLYSGLGYAGHYGYGLGYAGYPYTAYSGLHYYGKRSADAEPKADAYYGYYGYARPYGYVSDVNKSNQKQITQTIESTCFVAAFPGSVVAVRIVVEVFGFSCRHCFGYAQYANG